MNNGLFVSSFKRLRNLKRDSKRLLNRNRSLTDPFGQRLAVDILEHECQTDAGFLDAIDRGNVRVIQGC